MKESRLLPEYEKLIAKYSSHAPQLFKATQYSNKYDPSNEKINSCYQLINPKIIPDTEESYLGKGRNCEACSRRFDRSEGRAIQILFLVW